MTLHKEQINAELIVKIFRPLILHLYEQSNLVIPKDMNPEIEGPRLVAMLRMQGFNTRFPVVRRKD